MDVNPNKRSKLQRTYVATKRNTYQLVLNRGTVKSVHIGNGAVATQNQMTSINHNVDLRPISLVNHNQSILGNGNVIDQMQGVSVNGAASYIPGRIYARARKSFVAPLNENIVTQNNAIQLEADLSQHQDEMQKIIQNACSDLKTTFDNNMNIFLQSMEQINAQYADDVTQLKMESQSRLADLKRQYELDVEDAKGKVFKK